MKKNFILIAALLFTGIGFAQKSDVEIARELLVKNQFNIGLNERDLQEDTIKNTYYNQFAGTQMVYLQQTYLGLPVLNQLLVLAFKDGKLVSQSGGRLRKISALAGHSKEITFSAEEAVASALKSQGLRPEKQLEGKLAGRKIDFGDLGVCSETVTAELMWVPVQDGRQVFLCWEVRVVPMTSSDYLMIRVDARTNKIVNTANYTVNCNWESQQHTSTAQKVIGKKEADKTKQVESENNLSPNLVSRASYLVIPYPAESPIHPGGSPDTVYNPWQLSPGNATSLGWHNDGAADYTISRGNNVYSQVDLDSNNATYGAAAVNQGTVDSISLVRTPTFSQNPTIYTNQQFSLANLFYWNNLAHDIAYLHGFDEVSGNFQNNNLGRGGAGGDFVIADCQDAGGTNNANFATPDDGGKPRMQMYLWSGNPKYDGSLDNGVVTHEFAHGISNRLTGGPSNSSCLQNAEQAGEGWSDYFALMMTQNWATSDLNTGYNSPRSVGTYVSGQSTSGGGIRTQKYCTNMSVNSKVYAASIPAAQHDRGEIWCATLWDMTWNIINQTGTIDPDLFPANGTGGNNIALKLVLEGMKLQPCSPGFIDGRNAILKADSILYGGQFSCAIREAFRRRGMGALASQGSSDAVTDQVPDYSGGVTIELSQGGMTEATEGGVINYNIKLLSSCSNLNNYIVRDTLPSNVTYLSGGTYNSTSRVVTYTVNLIAGVEQNLPLSVRVNNGTYFTPSKPINVDASGTSLPAGWTTSASPVANAWKISNLAFNSAPTAFYSINVADSSDQRLISPPVALPAGTQPRLFFKHKFNTEAGWDGGVLEASINNGSTWTDLSFFFTKNGYNGLMGAGSNNPLTGRRGFTGFVNDFQESILDLTGLTGLSPQFRFRFGSDDNTAGIAGTPSGWFVDDIVLEIAPIVKMRAAIFSPTNVRLGYSDTVTYIVQTPTCINANIVTPPSDLTVCTGGNATFMVADQGTSNNYQWQISTDGGVSYADIQGANASSLILNNLTAAANNNQYRVVISNACPSSIISEGALLQVGDTANITTQPLTKTICEGNDANFIVVTTGSIYGTQWQVSTDGGISFTDIIGATSSSLDINNATGALNGNRYRVKLDGCNPLISSIAILNIETAPNITADPESATVCNGSNHTFNTLSGGSGLQYQWQSSSDGGTTFINIASANANSYSLNSVNSSMDNRLYRVIVTGSCPNPDTSAAALLTVSAALSVSAQPGSTTVCAGSDAGFSAIAAGVTGYQWQVSTDGGNTYSNISGANSNNLQLTAVTASMQGNLYRLILSNCGPDVNSNAAVLNVTTPVIPSFTQISNICSGSNFILPGISNNGINGSWSPAINNSATTTYTFTPASGQCATAASMTVNVTLSDRTPVFTQIAPICSGSSFSLPTTSTNGVNGTWSPALDNTATTAYTFTPNTDQCTNNTALMTVLVNNPTTPIFTAVDTICAGGNIILPLISNNGVSGSWSPAINNLNTTTYTFTPAAGACALSTFLTVAVKTCNSSFISPNPVIRGNSFTVRVPPVDNFKKRVINMYDSKGALVYQREFNSYSIEIDTKRFSVGTYLVRIWDANFKELATGKVVIAVH